MEPNVSGIGPGATTIKQEVKSEPNMIVKSENKMAASFYHHNNSNSMSKGAASFGGDSKQFKNPPLKGAPLVKFRLQLIFLVFNRHF